MLLDLSKLHGPREHVERTFQPADVRTAGRRLSRRRRRSTLVDRRRERRVARLTGSRDGWRRRWSSSAAGVSSDFTLPVDRAFELRYRAAGRERRRGSGAGNRRGRSDDRVLREGDARPRRADARAVLARAADEAAVRGVVQRPVPECGANLNRDRVRLRAGLGRPAARAAQGSAEPREGELSTCRIQNADIRRPARPSAARTTR